MFDKSQKINILKKVENVLNKANQGQFEIGLDNSATDRAFNDRFLELVFTAHNKKDKKAISEKESIINEQETIAFNFYVLCYMKLAGLDKQILEGVKELIKYDIEKGLPEDFYFTICDSTSPIAKELKKIGAENK